MDKFPFVQHLGSYDGGIPDRRFDGIPLRMLTFFLVSYSRH
jgi:hypothetical protein